MSDAPKRSRPLSTYIRWIGRAWRPHLRWLPVLLVMTLLSTGVTLAYPLVFGYVLEEIRQLSELTSNLDTKVHSLIGILLAIGVARFLASFYPAFRALVNSRIELFTREHFFHVVLRKGHDFFTRYQTGDVVTRLTDDIAGYPKIAWFCCSGLFRAFDSASRVVCCMAVMIWLNPELALYSLLPVPLMVAFFVTLNKKMRQAVVAQRSAASDTSAFLEAAFSGVTLLQAYNAEDRLAATLAKQLETREVAEVRLAQLWVLFSIFFQALSVVGQLVIVVLGGLWVIDGTLSLGAFFSFYLYLSLLLGPMMDLPNLLVTSRQAFVCMDRLDELAAFDTEGELDARSGDVPPGDFARLELKNVGFAYTAHHEDSGDGPPATVQALEGVNLAVNAGERLAVVGEIGSGKTTAVRVLGGIMAPQVGEVLLNDRPLASYKGQAFRDTVALVPQDPVLFSASVRENIVMGRAEDPELIARALRLAGLEEEVAAMPGGLDYVLGLRGRGLSGGQRQRLTIARALYADPKLLLLDDITAALDAQNEERFWNELFTEWPKASVLVVTHRAATARRMQRTVKLSQGRTDDSAR
jgi:ATP-binding cassette, subfamily B, multidrug efflux pump